MYIVNTICSLICIQAYRLPPENLDQYRRHVTKLLEREIRLAVMDDLRIFRTGMNVGPDLWAAETILALRDRYYPDMALHCYLPCETQANNWPESWREAYFNVLARADDVVCLQNHYTRGCMTRRNQEMISGSARLIAVHDNVAGGGVDRAIRYAEARGIETAIIRPMEGPDAPLRSGEGLIDLSIGQIKSQISSAYDEGFSTGTSAIRRA